MVEREHAHYPFLEGSKKAVRDAGMGGDIDARTLAAAKSRVISALKHRRIPAPSYFSQDDVISDIKSYAVARLLVSMVNRRMDAFIDAETMRALDTCLRNKQEKQLLRQLGVNIGDDFYVPLRDYLFYGSPFSSMMLSNKALSRGRVKIAEHEVNVILKEAIRQKIAEGLPIRESLISPELKEQLKPAVQAILAEVSLTAPGFGKQSTDIAPCMEKVLEDMRNGVKVRHLARWGLAVFLVKRGWDTDRIVQAFSGTPNFDERVTRYQIDHVRAKGYQMPSCYNLKSQGLCVAECGTKNPLQFNMLIFAQNTGGETNCRTILARRDTRRLAAEWQWFPLSRGISPLPPSTLKVKL